MAKRNRKGIFSPSIIILDVLGFGLLIFGAITLRFPKGELAGIIGGSLLSIGAILISVSGYMAKQ